MDNKVTNLVILINQPNQKAVDVDGKGTLNFSEAVSLCVGPQRTDRLNCRTSFQKGEPGLGLV